MFATRRWTLWSLAFAVVVSVVVVPTGCHEDSGALVVDVPSAASASPQYFHGNCLAGWSVVAELRARETNRVEVFLDTLSYRLTDQSTSVELGGETLDRATIETRYGANASVLPRGGSRIFRVSVVSSERPHGSLRISGGLAGRDENGNSVGTSFDIVGSLTVTDVSSPSGGACSPS